jgi:hypothetical protein
MSSATQCTKIPPGASGSSTTSANALAAFGTPLHSKGGETSSPSQVNLAGTLWPSRKAALVTVISSGASAPASVASSSEHPHTKASPSSKANDIRRTAM